MAVCQHGLGLHFSNDCLKPIIGRSDVVTYPILRNGMKHFLRFCSFQIKSIIMVGLVIKKLICISNIRKSISSWHHLDLICNHLILCLFIIWIAFSMFILQPNQWGKMHAKGLRLWNCLAIILETSNFRKTWETSNCWGERVSHFFSIGREIIPSILTDLLTIPTDVDAFGVIKKHKNE